MTLPHLPPIHRWVHLYFDFNDLRVSLLKPPHKTSFCLWLELETGNQVSTRPHHHGND